MAERRTVVVALVAAIAGAVIGSLATLMIPTTDERAPAETNPGDTVATAPATKPVAVPPARAARSANGPLDDVAPTAEEQTWLRDALLRERDRREKSVIRDDDGGLDVMDRWAKSGADVTPLVASYAAMRQHVRVPEGPVAQVASAGDETKVDLSAIDPKAAVIEFGPGRFVLSRGNTQWNVRREDVEALEIRGAGIDRTTLVGPGWAFFCCDEKASVKNLVLRDFTIDSTNPGQIVLDARGRMSVAVERVRFLGWEVAGHASVVGVSGEAFLACRDCDFVGPGNGFAVSLRGGAVAVLEDCRLSDVQSTLIGGGADALGRPSVVTLTGCTFENAPLADSRVMGQHGRAIDITVRGGSVALGGKSWTDDARRKKWGAEYAASVDGVTFGPAIPSFTVADLLRVLEAAPGQGVETVVRVDVTPGGRAGPTIVDLYAWDRAAAKASRRSFTWTNATLVPLEEKKPRRDQYRSDLTSEDVASYLPIVELVRRSGVAADEAVTGVAYGRQVSMTVNGAEQRTRWLEISAENASPRLVDAKTGEPLKSR